MPDLVPTQDSAPAKSDSACCQKCGNTPAIHLRPLGQRILKGDVRMTFCCSTPGCDGVIEIAPAQVQILNRAGVIASTSHFLGNLEKVSARTLHLMEHAENECDQIGAARVALQVERNRLKMAGMYDSGPKVLQQSNTFINFEPGDPIDRRLEAMARERAIPAEVVPSAFPPDEPPIDPPEEPGDTDEATGVL